MVYRPNPLDTEFLFSSTLNYSSVWAANGVAYDVISYVLSRLPKVSSYFHYDTWSNYECNDKCMHIICTWRPISQWNIILSRLSIQPCGWAMSIIQILVVFIQHLE